MPKGTRLDPVRTCLGCRQRGARSSLLRTVARDGAVVVDPSATLAGRGAWVHRDRECIDKAIARKAFGRALRADAPDTSQLRQAIAPAVPVGDPTGTP